MCPRSEIPAVQVGAICRAMLAAPNKSRFQRLQCLWLRAQQDLPTEAIDQTVGLSVSHVRRVCFAKAQREEIHENQPDLG